MYIYIYMYTCLYTSTSNDNDTNTTNTNIRRGAGRHGGSPVLIQILSNNNNQGWTNLPEAIPTRTQ